MLSRGGRPAPLRVEVKICGVARPRDAELAVELGSRYIGLNFYPPSPRCLDVERATAIADAVRGRARLVGVFVDRPRREIEEIADAVGLDLIQLHGNESPREVAAFGDRAIKVFRTGGDLAGVDLDLYPQAWGFLFDILHDSLYGGSGVEWPYRALADLEADRPVFVAGGIRPENARRAASESMAFGVDVCSGVESEPGIKDPARLHQLFEELRHGESPAPA